MSIPPDERGQADIAPVAADTLRTEKTSGVVRASGTMAVATLASRFSGFVAKVVLLAFFGASVVSDSYNLANTLPNIIFELLIGGVLTSVAIPLLSRARHDADGGVAYTQRLMTLAIIALAVATAAALAAAPLLIRLYQSGSLADPTLATQLAYLLLPQIFFYGIAALMGAILNTDERFAAPAWAPVVNNVVVIAVGVMLFTTTGTGVVSAHGLTSLTTGQFLLLGLGTTAGIVMQAAVMLPSLRRSGFRFRWRFGLDSRMAEAGRLMAWAIAYALISQAGYIVTARVAFGARDGFFTLYSFGSMLFQLPYGILGVSLLTAIMPRMSRHAAAGDMGAVKRDMSLANRLSTVALLPVTAAMVALAVPLAIVTARYGKVTDADARILAWTLAAFAIGLLPLAITLVQMRVFYAMRDGRTPTLINAIMVAVRIPLLLVCAALPSAWVVPGLAGAMSVSYVVGVAVGEIWLRVRFGHMGFGRTLGTIGRTAVASAIGGVAAWWVTTQLMPASLSDSLVGAIALLVVGGLIGLVVVGGSLLLLRVDEVDALRRRLVARRRPAAQSWNDGLAAAPVPSTAHADTQAQIQGQESVTDQRSDDATPRPGVFFTPAMVIGERYRLTRRVAYDGSGNEFWLARDTVLPRDMAVTLLPSTDPTSATVTRTLRVGRLHHPGLPQLLDVGQSGAASYLAGQWVDGATLPELLHDGPLEGAIVARLTAGIADALAEVHRAGFALGEVHPDLVRVGMDGRVRLSHIIARPSATADDDARAIGALIYLMLTGTWPLDLALGSAEIPAAPRRGATEVIASKVVGSAPSALSKLASDALHNAGSRGATVDDIGRRAREFGYGGRTDDAPPDAGGMTGPGLAIGSGGSARGRSDRSRARREAARMPAASGATPARVLRDRRLKLSIAGVMLVVLSVLIVIMGSSVVKQLLANVVAPIEAADQQELITVSTPTTTRTVAGTTAGSATAGSTSAAEAGGTTPVTVAGAVVYDPQGEPPADYESYVDRAFDGDLATFWPTWVYKQQFGPGGIKDGVGLMLTFSDAVAPAAVTLSTTTPGTTIEIRSADSAKAALDSTTVLGSATVNSDPVTITLTNAPTSKNLIVWITTLASYQGDTAANKGQFQTTISEISITR